MLPTTLEDCFVSLINSSPLDSLEHIVEPLRILPVDTPPMTTLFLGQFTRGVKQFLTDTSIPTEMRESLAQYVYGPYPKPLLPGILTNYDLVVKGAERSAHDLADFLKDSARA